MRKMTEIEFKNNIKTFEAINNFVLQVGLNEPIWSSKSEIDRDIEDVNDQPKMIKAALRFKEVSKNFSMPEICAYYLSKILNFIPLKNKLNSIEIYKDVKEILKVLNKDTIKGVDFLSPYILKYFKKKNPKVSLTLPEVKYWLIFFSESYHKINKLIAAHDSNNHIQDLIYPDRLIAQVLLLLQHLGLKFGWQSLPLWQVQNLLVSEGITALKSKHWIFNVFGTQCTVLDILQQPLPELTAWFFTEKVIKKAMMKRRMSKDKKQRQSFVDLVYQQFHGMVSGSEMSQGKLKEECSRTLMALQDDYGFNNKDVCQWMYDFAHIIETYIHLQTLSFKPDKPDDDTVRIYLLGDSVSAGYGILDPEQRWVNILGKLFEAKRIKCEIVNRSLVGYEASNGVEPAQFANIKRELEIFKPDIVLGTLCGNDAFAKSGRSDYSKAWVDAIQQNIEKLVELCQSHPTVKEVVWAGGIPETFRLTPQFRKDFTTMFTLIAKNKKITAAMLSPELLKASNIQEDSIHLKASVQPKVANEAYEVLKDKVADILRIKKAQLEQLPKGLSPKVNDKDKPLMVSGTPKEKFYVVQVKPTIPTPPLPTLSSETDKHIHQEANLIAKATLGSNENHVIRSQPGKLR